MKISKQARREGKALFRAVQVNGVVDEAKALQVVDAVLAQKPRGYLGILSHFQRLLKFDIERRSGRELSADPAFVEAHSFARSADELCLAIEEAIARH